MRIYKNCTYMLNETIREVFTRGQTVFDKTVQGKIVEKKMFEQKEIIGYAYRLNNFDDRDEMLMKASYYFNKEHLKPEIGIGWFKDMIGNETLRDTWWKESPYLVEYWKTFGIDKNGNFDYTYGERIMSQLPGLIKRLKGNMYSRGAQIMVSYPTDIHKIGKRIPCTTSYQFIARKMIDGTDELNLIVSQRSCDLINFFSLDIYKAILLLAHIANEIKVKPGFIIHNIGSLHSYKKDVPEDRKW